MDEIAPGLKTFDAFPKVSSSYSIRSTRGGAVTIVLAVVCLFMMWVQMAQYIGGVEVQQFSVDQVVSREMQINLDVTVNMECDSLTINAMDESHDHLFASELLKFEKVDFDGSKHRSFRDGQKGDSFHTVLKRARRSKFKSRKENKDGKACRIYGSLPVTRVQGDLHITTKMAGMFFFRNSGPLNFTHVIDEFSFGDFYPKLENPLDGVLAPTEEELSIYQYFMSVVPTTYVSSTTGAVVDTNQYSVNEQVTRTSRQTNHPPGIFFKYDMEPIRLTITDTRMPFSQWLVRLVNILGGLVVCTSWAYKLFEHSLRRALGKKPEERTLLDTGSQEEKEE